MISRRDKLLIHPWEQRRFEQHREKVKSAKAAIDRSPPIFYPHVVQKAKKQQSERERTLHVEAENVRLLQSLADIMRSKRMPDFWREPRPNFLGREKLFETRAKSAYHNWWSPMESAAPECPANDLIKRNPRCPTCNGRPEKKITIIPEARIPWQPPRMTFNKRLLASCYLPNKTSLPQKIKSKE
ncbi:uncharacterized protein LOC106084781 [Stomoxys calcitrans]|uniref:Uncharacterized protein n=1 Tax=Stomoxys calcitrans TaxID=35570 RepID=A0A1I8PGN8_STOCA|nr:uncharacterized protein LOC106084781 [Stomoxys calcitrans]